MELVEGPCSGGPEYWAPLEAWAPYNFSGCPLMAALIVVIRI